MFKPGPIAPNCKYNCPTIEGDDGDEIASYCENCERYLEQTVTTMNAARAIEKMNADPSL